jgi:hypothetical protein
VTSRAAINQKKINRIDCGKVNLIMVPPIWGRRRVPEMRALGQQEGVVSEGSRPFSPFPFPVSIKAHSIKPPLTLSGFRDYSSGMPF